MRPQKDQGQKAAPTDEDKNAKAPAPRPAAPPPQPPPPIAPLFRPVDWFTFALTTILVFIGYWWTLAPDMTCEDSGELAVASMYAGVPHPPGYPVWTIYSWLFTKLVPISNIAYRVGLSSAVAAAFACGLVALMVSRGSSMIIESIAELKDIARTWENSICTVSGFVAGLLIAFNGFMWSQAVIVEVYTLSVLSLTGVLVCLMRWIYAPQQNRYLYFAFFWFGICFNNHQSLLVIALGLEVAIVAVQPRLGRDLFFWNSVVYFGGLVGLKQGLISVLEGNTPLLIIYNLIGLTSLIAWTYLAFKTRKRGIELGRDFALVGVIGYLLLLFGHITSYIGFFEYKRALFFFFNIIGLGAIGAFVYLTLKTRDFTKEWVTALISGGAWALGAIFYLFMPLTSMTNPPMNWGYPRTVFGFFHAFTRGQYEKINPTTSAWTFMQQIWGYLVGVVEEFNLVYVLLAIIPFLFFKRMQKRERSLLIGLSAFYICLSFFLLILLNPAPDLQSRHLNKVFFTSSHVFVAMWIGYGLTLIATILMTHYEQYRRWVIIGGLVTMAIGLFNVVDAFARFENPLVHYTAIIALLTVTGVTAAVWLSRARAPLKSLLVLFACIPIWTVMAHWEDNEQRDHLFGYWFGHDMFTPDIPGKDGKPIYPEMPRDTILFGGTDPGRFNPTYMIFCESFIPPSKKPRDPKFDRRDVYLITQNALADPPYLNYIRAHYNRSTQPDPLFFSELLRGPREREQNIETNIIARMMLPIDHYFTDLGDRIEKKRRTGTSLFKETDFTDLKALVEKLRSGPQQDAVSQFIYQRLSKKTQDLMARGGPEPELRKALAHDLNENILEKTYAERRRLEEKALAIIASAQDDAEKKKAIDALAAQYRSQHQLYNPERFQHVKLSNRTMRFVQQNPSSHTLIRLDRILLEEAYPGLIATSIGGLYPDLEIHTPTPEDHSRCFNEYMGDVQRRMAQNQLQPGEDVKVVGGRVTVSGQTSVMNINALLTKVIFDKNPNHEFYIEESFPLQWMYPYLTPYGIIMKINREPVPEITQEIVDRDHEFWSKYSERAIGNWITYDTSISNICAFVEKTYLRRDYKGFKGDPKFVRDDNGQKAFSKLRSSLAGVYAWRLQKIAGDSQKAQNDKNVPEIQRLGIEYQRVAKEAEFAMKQSFAFCPYSPEATFRYMQLLLTTGRLDEARLIATTAQKFDPHNSMIRSAIQDIDRYKAASMSK